MGRVLLLLCLAVLVACGEEKTVEEYLQESRAYYAEGEFPAARIELLAAREINGSDPEIWFLLGKIHLELEENADAERDLRRAEELGWPVDETRPRIARALFGQGRFEEALALGTEGLATLPTARMLAVQVLAALFLGEYDAAQALYDGATGLAPEDIEIRLLGARTDALQGRLEEGLAGVDEVLSETPDFVEALRLRAHILLQMDHLEAARDAFTESIERSQIDFSDRVSRATVNIRLGALEQVAADLEALKAIAPEHPSVLYIDGLMAFHEGKNRTAVQSLMAADPMKHQFPLMLYFRSLGHLIDGDYSLAEEVAEEFVLLAPDSVRGRRLLALLKLKSGAYDEVEEVLQPARDFNPDDIYALNTVAHALLENDRADQAMFIFRWLRRIEPSFAPGEIPLGAGLILTELGAGREAEILAEFDAFDPFPREDILKIIGHLEKQEFEAALAAADSLKWRDTSGIAPYNVLAAVQLAAGMTDEAREVLQLALKRDPHNPSANLTLAGLARRDQDFTAERQYLQEVLVAHPEHFATLLSIAVWEGRRGHMDAMQAGLRVAVDFNPDLLEPRLALARFYLDNGDPDRVAPLFSDLLPLQQRSPRLLELFARAEIAQGNFDAAHAALSELLRTVRGSAEQYHLLAGAASALGRESESIAALEQALKRNENFVPAVLGLARRAELDGDRERLADYLERLIELAPDEPEVMRIQSVLAARDGNDAEALRLALEAHSAGPSSATLLQFAEMQRRAGLAPQARKLLSNWVRERPEDVVVRLALADQLYAQNQSSLAQAQYTRVVELDPDNVLALNNLAWLLRNSDPERSLGYARRAARLAPDDPMVLDSRAVIEYLNGKHRAAAVVILQARRADPDNPSIRYHQAMIQNALGEADAARAQLEEILGPGTPAFPEREEARALLDELTSG